MFFVSLPILYNTFNPCVHRPVILQPPSHGDVSSFLDPPLTDFPGFLPAAFYLRHSHNLRPANLFHNDHHAEVLHHPGLGHPVFQPTAPQAVGWGVARICRPRTRQHLREEQTVQVYQVSQTNSALVFMYMSHLQLQLLASPTLHDICIFTYLHICKFAYFHIYFVITIQCNSNRLMNWK